MREMKVRTADGLTAKAVSESRWSPSSSKRCVVSDWYPGESTFEWIRAGHHSRRTGGGRHPVDRPVTGDGVTAKNA